MPAHTFFLAVAAIIACTAAVAAADSTCVSNWPEARLAGLCNLELGGNVALSPGCTIYRLCIAANPGVRPFPKVCNVTKIFSSLCLDVPDAIPECASARSLVQAAGGNFSACLTASAFAVYNTSAVIGDIVYMCKAMGPAASSMAGCDLCPSMDRCQDPFNTLSIACLNMTMSKCTGWKAFCQTDAAIGAMVGVAAQTFCLKPAARTTPPPPSPPLGNSTCLVDPKKPACSKYKYEAGAADVEALCGSSSQLPACSIWSACKAGQLPKAACDPMTLRVPLCGAASGSPQAASCRGYSVLCGTAGSKVKQCVKATALRKLPKMSSVVTSLNATCWSSSASTVVPSFATTCANCTAEATCLDPLSTMSKVCVESKNSVSCKDFKAWCTAARAAAKRSYDMLCHY